MILLVIFAFIAGLVTILSPCILPVLPLILSSSVDGSGIRRPLGVITGFIFSFTFFTLFLTTLVKWSGIPAESLRIVSVIVIALFGITLIIPKFQLYFEHLISIFSSRAPRTSSSGFGGGILIGLSLGLLWTPCVGPILASVISLALTGTVSFDAFIITFAYAAGTAIPMCVVMLAGRSLFTKLPALASHTHQIQQIFGAIMVITALAISLNYDRLFQSFILKTFPSYGTGLTSIENNRLVQSQLNFLNENTNKNANTNEGKPLFDMQPKGVPAPDLIPGGKWFNTPDGQQYNLKNLRDKVVLVDFWTYSCINCQRTLPYIKKWWNMYKKDGFIVIGVHSPEFEFEKNPNNVAQAIKDFGLTYPVVQDNEFRTWRNYSNNYWPAKYLIDKKGFIRYTHFGEGEYDETEQAIRSLLAEESNIKLPDLQKNSQYEIYSQTPESYLGYGRMNNLASPEKLQPDTLMVFTSPETLAENALSLRGKWTVHEEYALAQPESSLYFNFSSKHVYLVMSPEGTDYADVEVYVDGSAQFPGKDVKNGEVRVSGDRLYDLVELAAPGRHLLKLTFPVGKVRVFAFTFG